MKAKLVVELIKAHSSGEEGKFSSALDKLADDEEKKGNISLSTSLKRAYEQNSSTQKKEKKHYEESINSFQPQGVTFLPKDKDSTLDLLDIIYPKVTLEDVALSDKTRETLQQVIAERSMMSSFLEQGISPTNRILFCGPPGCGKTLTANVLAGELGLPVAYVKLDGLVSSYLGQTGTNIRKIFDFVKDKNIVLFLDEFDAIAKKRDDSNELGELKRVVTTLLQNMDELPSNVFLVAATNHHHMLDSAIWRRFDLAILLELPTSKQRSQIISKNLTGSLFLSDKQFDMIIKLTEGMNGSQIKTFVESLIRYGILNKSLEKLTSDEIASIWLNHTSLFLSEDSEDYITALQSLNRNGISIRDLEKITGIPKSTLSYKFKNKEE